MKKLLLSLMLILSIGALASEASAFQWFFGNSYPSYSYSSGYYGRYGGYYGGYYSGYSQRYSPYMMDRTLSAVEREPMTRFSRSSTDSLYSYTLANRNYQPSSYRW